jgi:Fur family ferric uptake transcriptional regulator
MLTNQNDPSKKENLRESVKQIFTDYLVKNQQRKTPERYAILDKLYACKGHLNIDQLYDLLKDDYRVSRATIYNTLELLVDCNLIYKHQFNSDRAEYEKSFNNTHHHLICTKCKCIKEFGDESIKKIMRSKPLGGFHVKSFSIYAYGLCTKCSKAEKQKLINK